MEASHRRFRTGVSRSGACTRRLSRPTSPSATRCASSCSFPPRRTPAVRAARPRWPPPSWTRPSTCPLPVLTPSPTCREDHRGARGAGLTAAAPVVGRGRVPLLRHFGLTISASRPRGARARVENRGSGISRMRSIADRPLNCRWLSMSDMRVFMAIILLKIAPLCS